MLFSYRQVFELEILAINYDLTDNSKVLTYRALVLKYKVEINEHSYIRIRASIFAHEPLFFALVRTISVF